MENDLRELSSNIEDDDDNNVTHIKQKLDEILLPIKMQLANAKLATTQNLHTPGKLVHCSSMQE